MGIIPNYLLSYCSHSFYSDYPPPPYTQSWLTDLCLCFGILGVTDGCRINMTYHLSVSIVSQRFGECICLKQSIHYRVKCSIYINLNLKILFFRKLFYNIFKILCSCWSKTLYQCTIPPGVSRYTHFSSPAIIMSRTLVVELCNRRGPILLIL